LRPLIAYDKDEITALARRIGTFATSIEQSTPCPFLPDHPITSADLDRAKEILGLLEQRI
jgi:thiamine biosynthesis protein ThiI